MNNNIKIPLYIKTKLLYIKIQLKLTIYNNITIKYYKMKVRRCKNF